MTFNLTEHSIEWCLIILAELYIYLMTFNLAAWTVHWMSFKLAELSTGWLLNLAELSLELSTSWFLT